MTTITHSRSRRIAAAAGAFALAAAGVLGFAGSASADPIGGVGNIVSPDPGTGSITVHKYTKTSTNGSTAGDGTQVTPTGAPIPGVTFTVREVLSSSASLPLLTNAGWTTANAIQGAFSPASPVASLTAISGVTLTAGTSVVTNASGDAAFANLHYGLYLVQETAAPANVTDPSLPFLVTVPFPTGAANATNPNEWLYAVHVYPKNAVTGVTKAVKSADTAFRTAADYVTWTIGATVPTVASGGINTFTVADTVDPAQLSFVTGTVPSGISPRAIRVFNAGGTDVTSNFTLTTDYTYTVSGTNNEVQTLAFTSTGRADLATYASGGRVEFDVPTQVVAVPTAGTVLNSTHLVANSGTSDASSSQDFGKLRVLKFAMTDVADVPTKTPLAGATFEVYADADADGVADAGELVTVNGATSWTTDAAGIVNIPALKPGAYLLKETAAPVGYQALSAVVPATVVAGDVVATGTVQNYVEVENSQLPPWLLPFTGGNGVLTFTIVGAGLMALAFGFAFVAFRRRKQAEQA
ncbi:SpaH/EbpB family LPXTG-anchored major pilin [Protaetiibacter larvae]|nr:SpaH/EbpB family LPXTG-anchored major pilin [Protaetiibacter larvae]